MMVNNVYLSIVCHHRASAGWRVYIGWITQQSKSRNQCDSSTINYKTGRWS